MNALRLHPINGEPTISVEHAIVRVGRDSSSDIHLKDASVSRQHAEITRRGEEWVIVDQNSGNGIHVDGRRVQQAVLLPGQHLQIGNLKFRVEIDRGDDGATVMLGRSPLLEDAGDRTLMGTPPPRFPVPDVAAEPASRRTGWMIGALVAVVVVIGGAFAAVNYFSDRQVEEDRRLAAAAATPRPTPKPTPTPTPESTPSPTPAPTRRPMGILLISTDADARVSIDGRTVAELKTGGLRRFEVAPGEHIVRFLIGEAQTEVVARVRVNEQTVVRRQAEPMTPSPAAAPSATATPTPR